LLLVCAAIGVATGIIGGIAGAADSGRAGQAIPWAYGLLLGSHVLPGIIAQEVLRRPLVALITHCHRRACRERVQPGVVAALHRHGAAVRRDPGGRRSAHPLSGLGCRWRFFISAR
jgi:hypothetical protein